MAKMWVEDNGVGSKKTGVTAEETTDKKGTQSCQSCGSKQGRGRAFNATGKGLEWLEAGTKGSEQAINYAFLGLIRWMLQALHAVSYHYTMLL